MPDEPIYDAQGIVSAAPNLCQSLEANGAAVPDNIQDRARGIILGLAVGNLLGLPVEGEGWTPERISQYYPAGVREIDPEEKHRRMDDDLAQTVDLGEALLAGGDYVNDLGRRLVHWRRVNARGIGITTNEVINYLENEYSPPEAGRIVYEKSGHIAPNGGVMRCAPVALACFGNAAALVRDSAATCTVTHYAPSCQWSCIILNVAIALLLRGGEPQPALLAQAAGADGAPGEVVEWVAEVGADIDSLRWNQPHIGHTLLCLQNGLWALVTPLDFEAALVQVVSAGGDTDTNGAVTGAVLGARYGAAAIPQRWLECVPQLERLEKLADDLLAVGR